MSKKKDFEDTKVHNYDFSTESVPDTWGPKNRTNWGIPVACSDKK